MRSVASWARTSKCLRDRKSTRLNSSHSQISYAVFCLKKKKKTRIREITIILANKPDTDSESKQQVYLPVTSNLLPTRYWQEQPDRFPDEMFLTDDQYP